MELLESPLVEMTLRITVIYFVVWAGLRLLGKREVGQCRRPCSRTIA